MLLICCYDIFLVFNARFSLFLLCNQVLDGLPGILVCLFASDVLASIGILGFIYPGSSQSMQTNGHQNRSSACKIWEILKQDYYMKPIFQRTFEDHRQIKQWNFSSEINTKRRNTTTKMLQLLQIKKRKKKKKGREKERKGARKAYKTSYN